MAATADPRAKPPAATSHQLKPWAQPRAHRVPLLPDVSGGGARDRRRSSSSSHRRDAAEEEPCDGRLEDLRPELMSHLRLPTAPQQGAPAARPWNLRDRKRRPSARAAEAAAASLSPATSPWDPPSEKALYDERTPFAVALTVEEVEEDIYALTGVHGSARASCSGSSIRCSRGYG